MSDADLLVRQLKPADAADFRTIRLLALKSAPAAFGSAFETEAGWPVARFAERLVTSAVFGAYRGARIVGMAGLRREEGPKVAHKGFVWGVFVDPAARGGGLAEALLQAIITHAGGRFEQITLRVVTTNAPAIALYRRQGFLDYGVEPKALKSAQGYADEILMVRWLP